MTWTASVMPDDALDPTSLVGRLLRPEPMPEPPATVELMPLWRVMELAFAGWDWQGGDPAHAGPGFAAEIEALRDWLDAFALRKEWLRPDDHQRLRALLTAQARIARGEQP